MTIHQASPAKESAVRSFMDRFSYLPASWLALVAEHIDEEECVAMPMWGRLWKLDDSGFEGPIRRLMDDSGFVPKDPAALIEWAEQHGLDIEDNALRLLALAGTDDADLDAIEDDIEDIRSELLDAYRDHGSDDVHLHDSGWQRVGDTGFIARDFDGHLCLGVNGAGYSMFDAHWIPLYDALGLTWHEQED